MPNSWALVPLGEVLTERQEVPPAEAVLRGEIPIVAKVGFNDGQILLRTTTQTKTGMILVRPGDLLVSGINAGKGAIAVYGIENEKPIAATIHYGAYIPNKERGDVHYLWWLLRSRTFRELLTEYVPGGIKTELKAKRLLPVPIPLPPLDEQQRIVARIEQLAAKVAEARHLRDNAATEIENLWPSILAEAFRPCPSRTTVAEETAEALLLRQAKHCERQAKTKYNNAHPWQPSISRDGQYQLPSDWVWTDLGSAVTQLVDCVNDTPDFADDNTGLLGLKSTNVRPYALDLSERWFVTPEDFARWNRRDQPQAGDLILTREAPMGNVCLFPDGLRACLTQRLMLLRSHQSFVDRRYLLHFLNSPDFANQVLDSCRGLTTPHIRVQDAPFVRMPLAPLPEQRRIVAYLDNLQAKVDALKRLQAESAAELDALSPSILDKAFKGEL